MDLWVTEYQTPSLGFSCKVRETLRYEKTEFQELSVVETEQFGKMLLLDGMVQTTEQDEFVYHEMITLVALNSHRNPEKVLIIGGGDGGTLREVVKHPAVSQATLVEIDERVVTASRDFFPDLACSFNEPKAEVLIADGIEYVKQQRQSFDLIIVDSTEPVGPAVQLFSREFYQSVSEALKNDGMLVVQSESPFYNQNVIKMAFGGINQVFPLTKLYLANIPTYPSGLWSFTVGSKLYDPQLPSCSYSQGCKYYTAEIHQAAFQLPAFVNRIIETEE
ncbi:MAG: polyamine aminopropyltransferase [Syntrophomonas sp.]|uniref:polyamine aminopropyltransferase n=1 Tax=Syntrophomonas sp. TaxID=2053627 RepID=UPI0026140222|nr:polyamine aminopropyltransferase [Syntrophomonas sp.]MDD2510900.1 polyamine aminopropyltransferase [Syntrophomonas sp.]MDD3878447.1 polyamine aminopropyltransferase [Syntrophomonas sp.]MDD4625903.1 polyamine aminopropyltransferase [Syntrophomonas sp.]